MANLEQAVRHIQSIVLRVRQGITFGVRGLVTREGQVFLVRHTYVPGWYLPGGAVEPGESAGNSLKRELEEEGNIHVTGELRLLGVFFNSKMARRDHVVVYHADQFDQPSLPLPNREIAEVGWFDMNTLPQPMNAGSERRIQEYLGRAAISEEW